MNFICALKISDILKDSSSYLPYVPIIIGLSTLYLAYLVRKEFLRNQTKTKQIEVMSNLITELNTLKIKIEAWRFNTDLTATGTGWTLNYNLFEIADLYTTTEKDYRGAPVNFEDYDDQPVLFEMKSNQIGDIKKFIDNPFLPKAIADRLVDFYSQSSIPITREEISETPTSVILLTTNYYEKEKAPSPVVKKRHYIKSHALVFESWLNLKAHSHELMKAIKGWFLKHGIDDVNLRIDYKN
jgi:hypothetical protein